MNIDLKLKINNFETLFNLNSLFNKEGFEIRFVGGCVRDMLINVSAHDIDLCTNANVDQQLHVYKKYNIKHINTGLQHGTITVILNNVSYEITSLRTDVSCDGRHAITAFTNNWKEDLARRDLTINAIEVDFHGNIFDPFNGVNDLKNNIVKFIGNPEDRINEDHLRILRFFRFLARFDNNLKIDEQTNKAINKTKSLLKSLSGERIWSEMSRIFIGKNAPKIIALMGLMHVNEFINMSNTYNDFSVSYNNKSSAITNLILSLKNTENLNELLIDLQNKWKFSNTEYKLATFLSKNINNIFTLEQAKKLLVMDHIPLFFITEHFRMTNQMQNINLIENWNIPVFPINGNILIQQGFKSNIELGTTLFTLKEEWANSDYKLTEQQLLNMVI